MAGSDAGHAFAALGLAERLLAAGDEPIVYTGLRWVGAAARRGLIVRDLPGLAVRDDEDDGDAGAKLSTRAARMAVELAPVLAREQFELVVSDSITVAGGWAAELCGIPWIELSSHPLYEQSRKLPPIGAGLDVGVGVRGRLRDALLRALSRPAERKGRAQRRAARLGISLSPDAAPAARFVATLPGLEVPRADWPGNASIVGPMFFEPTDEIFAVPAGDGPLIVVCPSTAESGSEQFAAAVLGALALPDGPSRRAVYSALTPPDGVPMPPGMVTGLGRQDLILAHADVVICGAGHGLLAKALSAGVPTVMVPGGGDQWELACRVQRAGAGVVVRPATVPAVAEAIERVLGDPAFTEAARRIAVDRDAVADPVVLTHAVLAGTVIG